MRRVLTWSVAGACAGALLCASSAWAQGHAKVRLNMASTFPSSMVLIGEAAKKLPAKIARASGGEIELRFHEPGHARRGARGGGRQQSDGAHSVLRCRRELSYAVCAAGGDAITRARVQSAGIDAR